MCNKIFYNNFATYLCGRDMLICRGNRQFGLHNIWRNVYMCTCAWQFAKLKMSDVSDDSYLYDVAAAAAYVVLTVDITKRNPKKRCTWVRPLYM